MIDLTHIEFKENNSPKEPAFYAASFGSKINIIQVCINCFNDLVILQPGTNRQFCCDDTEKEYKFSDRLNFGNPDSDFVI